MAANVPASRAPAPGHNDYTIGWIAALPVEFAAARAMLTHRHKRLPVAAGDSNAYFLGSIGDHNIAIACINEAGGLPASIVASNMVKTFPSVRYVRMVGIGGGIRSEKYPIQLGDIVVSEPSGIFGGVVQSDYGKWEPDGFKRTGSLNRPADGLIRAIGAWRALYYSGESQIHRYVKHLPSGLLHPPGAWVYQGTANDPCYNKDDDCGCTTACEECEARTPDPQVHYGIIASGNQVIKSERQRNWIRDELGACCVEMEAFGLMNSFPCLTIRGISDYADGRKNDLWQPYAALTAAAYAKELLLQLAAVAVDSTPNIIDQLGQCQ
ncbi:nucleoside phosphorylase domain-containing protein [Aspergillus insuetus]